MTILIEFDDVDKRPSKPATPGDKRISEALPIYEGSEVNPTQLLRGRFDYVFGLWDNGGIARRTDTAVGAF